MYIKVFVLIWLLYLFWPKYSIISLLACRKKHLIEILFQIYLDIIMASHHICDIHLLDDTIPNFFYEQSVH